MGSVEAALNAATGHNIRKEASSPLAFHGRRVSDKDRTEFCTQLAVMLQARVPLHRAVEVLALQTKSPRMKGVIEGIGTELRRGMSFDRALTAHPEVFSSLFVVTCEVGQESGRLPEVLMHLARHLEKMNALGRKVRQALAYPGLVLTVAIVAVAFLMLFVVPTFAEMFASFRIELPASTQVILEISRLVKTYGIYFLGGGIALAWGWMTASRNPGFKRWGERILVRLPIVGEIVIKTHVARFCRTLGTLLKAQVSLVDALAVTSRIASNADLKGEIGQIISDVRSGHAVARPLESSRLFPPMVVQMVAVGEETSELDTMLLKVADYYESEIDSSVELLSTVIEPMIILFLGAVVAGILVAMYMPMFDLINIGGGTLSP